MNTEYRRAKRRKVGFDVDVTDTMTGHVIGKLSNLSETGMLLILGQPLTSDALYQLRFTLVDDAGRELPERHEGRIEFRGPSTTSGYYRNAEATLAHTIESVLAQDHGDFELLVLDGASTDKTAAVARGFAGDQEDAHLKL